MNLKKLTAKLEEVAVIYTKKYRIKRSGDWYVMKIQEELGELAAAYLKLTKRGRTKKKTRLELEENFKEEFADVLSMLLLFARHQGIDMDKAVKEKWLHYLDKPEEL